MLDQKFQIGKKIGVKIIGQSSEGNCCEGHTEVFFRSKSECMFLVEGDTKFQYSVS